GAASAASRLIYYALVVAGIMFALAASGVELSKLTLVISALGVGIGFGLQNIVNNFVSGLILAFERPVREGDQITLGTTMGRVSMIGLRATRIRTPEGAEVIVPNASLIASEVTNWTLSDRTRRIDVAVGVDYGSDPAEVQALLLDAIKGQVNVATVPGPMTVFRGFGASSLDFSLLLWATDFDHRFSVETEARTRVLAALRSAGVIIPFPQLDVRVKDDVTLTSGGPPATRT
ncbi:MAG: mechanosensitive ion channel, partial [Gammaproteobacteria bacterium]|nr:mechanosensitive ion channel [Gammaproteobacteria bacterium]